MHNFHEQKNQCSYSSDQKPQSNQPLTIYYTPYEAYYMVSVYVHICVRYLWSSPEIDLKGLFNKNNKNKIDSTR